MTSVSISETVNTVMRASEKRETYNFLSSVCTVANFTTSFTATDLPHEYLLQSQSVVYFAYEYSVTRVFF
jgi:hypothetical protein